MQEKKKMMHVGLSQGDIGHYVFLPGSPERAKKISTYFDHPTEVAYNREYHSFNGTLEDTLVTVCSTGIGGPSTAIAVEELHECGAHTMIRVGTCASVSPLVGIGDIVIPNGAVRMEGVGRHYLPVEYPAVPDMYLLEELEKAAVKLKLPYNVGITITKASFYTQNEAASKPYGYELVNRWESYVKGGATSTEMESAPLFLIAGSLGIRAATVLVSATNDRDYSDDHKNYPADLEHRAIEVAVEAMRQIIRQDKEALGRI